MERPPPDVEKVTYELLYRQRNAIMLLWTEALRDAEASLERFTFPPIPHASQILNACFRPAETGGTGRGVERQTGSSPSRRPTCAKIIGSGHHPAVARSFLKGRN